MPFIATAIAALGTAFAGSAAAGTFLNTVIGRILVSTAIGLVTSVVSQALATTPKPPGLTKDVTQTGGVNPTSFILGYCCTAGQANSPAMSHGTVDDTPNSYLTYVIELSDIRGMTLEGLIVNGIRCPISGTPTAYGTPVTGKYAGNLWVKYYDGTQTTADATMISRYGSQSPRPWQTDMIGRDVCYAIVTFLQDREKFPGFPNVRFEVSGIPLYDPRKDTSVGGSGSQRWNDRTTWQPSNNPIVQIYNIMRGIRVDSGVIWGGNFDAEDIPLSSAFAAMNICDIDKDAFGGGTEDQYRTGFEVTTNMEPSDVIEELLKSCAGQVSEVAGYWKFRVGAMNTPTLFIDDESILVSKSQDYQPFPTVKNVYNGVTATYPEPRAMWEPKEAPAKYNATYKAEDLGQTLTADLQFNAVPYRRQVQRLMAQALKDSRQFRIHGLTLSSEASICEPLDVIQWTSTANGYSNKKFEIDSQIENLKILRNTFILRERNPSDFDGVPAEELDSDADDGTPVIPAAITVPGASVTAFTINGNDATGRRPGIRLNWTGTGKKAIRGIEYEIRLDGTTELVGSGSRADVESGKWVIPEQLLPATNYEVRMRFVSRRASSWTSWFDVTTGTIYLDDRDTTLPDIEGNEILNGRFKYGDARHWNSPLPTGWAVIERTGAVTPISTSPTRYMLKALTGPGADGISGTIQKFDASAGEKFSVSAKVAVNSVGSVPVDDTNFVIEFFDKDDVELSQHFLAIPETDLSATWTRFRLNCPAAPANTTYGLLRILTAGISAGAPTYITRIILRSRSEAEDRNDDASVSTLLMKPQATRRRIANYTASQTATVTNTDLCAVTNSTDEEAHVEPADMEFTCQVRYDPPSGDTAVRIEFEFTGPGAFSRTYQQTLRNFGGGTASLYYAIGLTAICPAPGGALPDNYKVKVLVSSGSGTVEVLRAQLRVIMFKK